MAVQACHVAAYPRLAATNDSPSPCASERRAPALKLVPRSPAPSTEPEPDPEFRRRDLYVSTQGATTKWRELADAHAAARMKLNATLPNVRWSAPERALGIEPATSTDDPRLAEALRGYRSACARLFEADNPRPRDMRYFIRAIAEICGVQDPVSINGFERPSRAPETDREQLELVLAQLDHIAFRIDMAQERRKPRCGSLARARDTAPEIPEAAPSTRQHQAEAPGARQIATGTSSTTTANG